MLLGAGPPTPAFSALRQWHGKCQVRRILRNKANSGQGGSEASALRKRDYGESGVQTALENKANGPAVGVPEYSTIAPFPSDANPAKRTQFAVRGAGVPASRAELGSFVQ
jgi:hypothetical protein